MTPRNPQPPSAGDPEDHESTGDRQRHESSPRPSLSARSRGEGWDVPEGGLAKYRSRWRAAARFVLQRGIFRLVMHSAITPSSEVHRRVRSVRGRYVLVDNHTRHIDAPRLAGFMPWSQARELYTRGANHTSHIDAPLLAESLPWSQARYLSTGVAYDYWFTHRPRRWLVRSLFNAFPVDRDGSRKHSGTSRRLLRSGVPILVFPEGGRQTDGRMKDFKPGGAALAIGVGVPVIPAAMIGGYEPMPKGRSWPTPGRPAVGVVFGEPMIAEEGESAVAFSARIRERLKTLYDQHYDEILAPGGRDEEEAE